MNSALLHFLWQGAAIAFLLTLVLVFVTSARVRYACACAALLAMPVAFAVTFAMSLPSEPSPVRVPIFFTPSPMMLAAAGPPTETWSFDPALLWMIGVAVLYGYRLLGWFAAQRLRRRGVCTASGEWQQRVVELGVRLRMTRPVLLLESALAGTPMTIGWWRPVILMPLGLLAGLPGAQVEAILLHELAHVRRHDYLVNLLQAVVEGLLFYHPAVWWVSHVIRREREMCCDDLVVAASGDAPTYTRALAALEQHRVRVPALAVTGGPLMVRIQRLLGQPGKFSPVPALVFLALATGAALFAFEPFPAPAPIPIPAPLPAPIPDPAPIPTPAPGPQAALQVPPASPAPEETRVAREARLLRELETPYIKWLNEEVVWIVTPEERSAFLRLNTDDERQMFIEQFWLRRDPTPGTQQNEAREEYYRRIAWANARFADPGSQGWTSDRGMMYIRFGAPDEKEEHPGDPSTYAYEKWRYRYLEGIGNDVVVGFVDQLGDGVFRMSWDDKVRNALLSVPGSPGLQLFELRRILRDYVRLGPER